MDKKVYFDNIHFLNSGILERLNPLLDITPSFSLFEDISLSDYNQSISEFPIPKSFNVLASARVKGTICVLCILILTTYAFRYTELNMSPAMRSRFTLVWAQAPDVEAIQNRLLTRVAKRISLSDTQSHFLRQVIEGVQLRDFRACDQWADCFVALHNSFADFERALVITTRALHPCDLHSFFSSLKLQLSSPTAQLVKVLSGGTLPAECKISMVTETECAIEHPDVGVIAKTRANSHKAPGELDIGLTKIPALLNSYENIF
jgi:hypothetical protein